MSAEVDQLRAEVAALTRIVEAATSLGEQEADLTAAAITRLENAVTGLLGQPGNPTATAAADRDEDEDEEEEEEEAPEPVAWVDYATARDWVSLADWVDWLTSVYDLHEDRRVRPCWPAHLGVAEELAALHSAWREAASRAREADGDALAFWHDRYLTPLMARINHMYATLSCQGKHALVRVGPMTNRTLIDVRSAATGPDDGVAAAS